MASQNAFSVPIVTPTGPIVSASEAFGEIVSDDVPAARKITIVHDENVTRLIPPQNLSDWSSNYSEANKTLVMTSTFGTSRPVSTAKALQSIEIEPGKNQGVMETTLDWNDILTWTIEDVYTIAGETFKTFYDENIAGNNYAIVNPSIAPDNQSFAFGVYDASSESATNVYYWIGAAGVSSIEFSYVDVVVQTVAETFIIPVNATTCLVKSNSAGSTFIDRYTKDAEGTFSSQRLADVTEFTNSGFAAESENLIMINGHGSPSTVPLIYFYDGTSTLVTVSDFSGTIGYRNAKVAVSLGNGLFLSGGNSFGAVISSETGYVRDIRYPVSINDTVLLETMYADTSTETAYLVAGGLTNSDPALVLYSVTYAEFVEANAVVTVATLLRTSGEIDGAGFLGPVTGFSSGELILSTSVGTTRNVQRARVIGGEFVIDSAESTSEDSILGPTLGVAPEFQSNNGTGIAFSSGTFVGVYSVSRSFNVAVAAQSGTATATASPTPAKKDTGNLALAVGLGVAAAVIVILGLIILMAMSSAGKLA